MPLGKNEIKEEKETPKSTVDLSYEDTQKEEDNLESILWTGFNFINVYHFCPDASHKLHHHTVWIPDIGIVHKGRRIFKKDGHYFLKEGF